jgi:hypothetical protein
LARKGICPTIYGDEQKFCCNKVYKIYLCVYLTKFVNMARYKCPECGREYETHSYCNHHRTSVKCIERKSGGLFGNIDRLPNTNPGSSLGPNTLKGLKYKWKQYLVLIQLTKRA